MAYHGDNFPGPLLNVDPTQHDFGTNFISQAPGQVTLVVSNLGAATLDIDSLSFVGSNVSAFSVSPLPPIAFAGGADGVLTVSFTPTNVGLHTAELQIGSDSPTSPDLITFSGTGSIAPPQFEAIPPSIGFPVTAVGTSAPPVTLVVSNIGNVSHTLMAVDITDDAFAEYTLTPLLSLPIVLQPGETASVNVDYTPERSGTRSANAALHFDANTLHHIVPLSGIGQGGGTRTLYRVNSAGPTFTNGMDVWEEDSQYHNTGNPYTTVEAISNTVLDTLYQSQRWDPLYAPNMEYAFPAPAGLYSVQLHFAEIFNGANFVGARVFNVQIEGQTVLTNFDIYAEAELYTALIKDIPVITTDGFINVTFSHSVENPNVSGFEVLKHDVELTIDQQVVALGHLPLGQTSPTNTVVLTNLGGDPLEITELGFILSQGVLHDFTIRIDGQDYVGDHESTNMTVSIIIPPGGTQAVDVIFEPTEESGNDFLLAFRGAFAPVQLHVSGTGGESTGHPFLHVVIRTDPYYIDFDGNGSESVFMFGDDSHTHEFGHALISNHWVENSQIISTNINDTLVFSNGAHTLSLTIYDDNLPPETLSDSETFHVLPPTLVPGTLARYYETGSTNPAALINVLTAHPDFGERLDVLEIDRTGNNVGSKPFVTNMLAQLTANVNLAATGTYTFALSGGKATQLRVDGNVYTGALVLASGPHAIDARYALIAPSNAPLGLTYSLNGGGDTAFLEADISHDESSMLPILNTAPAGGFPAGGELTQITGLGFFLPEDVIVHWGSSNIVGSDLDVVNDLITFSAPPGDGTISISVETTNGTSRSVSYVYSAGGPAPINFDLLFPIPMTAPTQMAWGPDGRLYVAKIDGTIEIFTFDANYVVVTNQVLAGVSGESNSTILGLGFNPYDAATNVRIYVSHSELNAHGGACFDEFSPYNGEISILEGTNLTTITSLISGLPVSNHDHAVNGLVFDNNGDLLFVVGGNSNAGIPACNLGDVPESPLSAAMLFAEITKPGFNGVIEYVESGTSTTNNDQRDGQIVDVIDGVDVRVYAHGIRNAFDLAYTTEGRIYATDNGPNASFGPTSTGPDTEGPEPETDDEFLVVEEGHYYGHPNRNRGRYDGRQNIYYDLTPPSEPYIFTQGIGVYLPSLVGIEEYRASTFNNAMRGQILFQKWGGITHLVEMSDDGELIETHSTLPVDLHALDVVAGPGGAVIGTDYLANALNICVPVDVAGFGLTVYDIFPWRAPGSGGHNFVIGGNGFGTISNTSVTIGSFPATLTSVSTTRIHGIIPLNPNPRQALLDVTVTVAGIPRILSDAFRFLTPQGQANSARASVVIDSGGTFNESSTYSSGTFRVTNLSPHGQTIERLQIDLRSSLFPDLVFDPTGAAGDPIGKPFTVDVDPGVGYVTNVFLNLHDGGFDVLRADFTNWSNGAEFRFSLDIDPTSIKGATQPGPSHSGSISGLELMSAQIRLTFSDGVVAEASPFAPSGSQTLSSGIAKVKLEPAPYVDIIGVGPASANVTNASQVARIYGPAGSTVELALVEAALYTNGVPGAGFDLDPFEANTALSYTNHTDTVGIDGYVDVPMTLQSTEVDGGYNYITCAIRDEEGDTGRCSERIVLRLPFPAP